MAFGRDFFADAERRDFTINALSLGPDGRVHDPVGGLDDLAAGRVRFIGDAEAAHPRGLSADSAVLPLFGPIRQAARLTRGSGRCDPRARRPRPPVARARARRTLKAHRRPARGRGRADDGGVRISRADPRRHRLSRTPQPSARDRGGSRYGARRDPAARRARRRDSRGRGAAARSAAARQRRMAAACGCGRGADRRCTGSRRRLAFATSRSCCSRPSAAPRATPSRSRRPNSSASADDAAFAEADRFLAETPEPKLPLAGRILSPEAFRAAPGLARSSALFAISGSRPDFRRTRRRSTCC